MEKINCLIVEDEPLAAELLAGFIEQVPFLENRGTCRDAIFAMELLQQEKIDVLFLDIHLPRINGMDFIKTIRNPPQVIITTAYRDYAVESYDLDVVDYLLKPIQFQRFLAAVNRVKKTTAPHTAIHHTETSAVEEKNHLWFSINKKKMKICLNDILYIESRKEYISIATLNGSLPAKCSLAEIETRLPKGKFLRVHRSFIIAKDKIRSFSAASVEMEQAKIPVGRSYREMVLGILKED